MCIWKLRKMHTIGKKCGIWVIFHARHSFRKRHTTICFSIAFRSSDDDALLRNFPIHAAHAKSVILSHIKHMKCVIYETACRGRESSLLFISHKFIHIKTLNISVCTTKKVSDFIHLKTAHLDLTFWRCLTSQCSLRSFLA